MTRQPWQDITIRETPEGPEIVFDAGVSGWPVPVTEEDLATLGRRITERRQAQAAAAGEAGPDTGPGEKIMMSSGDAVNERKYFPYLRLQVVDGEVRTLPFRMKKKLGRRLGLLAGAHIIVTRTTDVAPEGVISGAIRLAAGGGAYRGQAITGPTTASLLFADGTSGRWQIAGAPRGKAEEQAAEFNRLAGSGQ